MPHDEISNELIRALIKNEEENVKCLRDIHSLLTTLMECEKQEHERINTNMSRHMAALVGLIALLIIGVFALVNIKLQAPIIPLP